MEKGNMKNTDIRRMKGNIYKINKTYYFKPLNENKSYIISNEYEFNDNKSINIDGVLGICIVSNNIAIIKEIYEGNIISNKLKKFVSNILDEL